MQQPQFKAGERVVFDVEGAARSPFGAGVIEYVDPKTGDYRIRPDYPFAFNAKLINVRKA